MAGFFDSRYARGRVDCFEIWDQNSEVRDSKEALMSTVFYTVVTKTAGKEGWTLAEIELLSGCHARVEVSTEHKNCVIMTGVFRHEEIAECLQHSQFNLDIRSSLTDKDTPRAVLERLFPVHV